MAQILGLLLLSFFITSVLLVPFIDFLFKLRMNRTDENKRLDVQNNAATITAKLLAYKHKRPIGAGALIVAVTGVLSLWAYGLLGISANPAELFILLFTMFSFGLLGLYDDIRKNFNKEKTGFFGLRWRHKLIIQTALG
ncbi:MAG: hypothetical protein AAB838_04180, partial [Patescibacteria group bacterium]